MHPIDFIFPRQCINCSVRGAYLCKNCKKKLEPHPEICPYCHRYSKDYLTCIECRCDKNNCLEGIIIPFAYTSLLKKLIIKLKYFHKKDIGNFLVERLAIALQANQTFQKNLNVCLPFSKGEVSAFRGGGISYPQLKFSGVEFIPQSGTPPLLGKGGQKNKHSNIVISFIPSHRYRHYFIKGYNQSELLARKLSEHLHVPIITLATKQKRTKTQASLDRNGRLHNLKNAFSLARETSLIGNETIIIIDDITTTGSTINELAKLVKQSYPKIKIRGAVLGRHR